MLAGIRAHLTYANVVSTIAAVGFAWALLPPFASAAKIGPRDISAAQLEGAYSAAGCTYSNVRIPKRNFRSPLGGTITRWRVHIPAPHDTLVNDGPLRLQVLKRIDNQPGVVNDQFQVVRETSNRPVTPIGQQGFNASVPIRKGQFIGFTGPSDTEVGAGNKSGAYHFQWCPALTPGATGGPADFTIPGDYLLFNATVKD